MASSDRTDRSGHALGWCGITLLWERSARVVVGGRRYLSCVRWRPRASSETPLDTRPPSPRTFDVLHGTTLCPTGVFALHFGEVAYQLASQGVDDFFLLFVCRLIDLEDEFGRIVGECVCACACVLHWSHTACSVTVTEVTWYPEDMCVHVCCIIIT